MLSGGKSIFVFGVIAVLGYLSYQQYVLQVEDVRKRRSRKEESKTTLGKNCEKTLESHDIATDRDDLIENKNSSIINNGLTNDKTECLFEVKGSDDTKQDSIKLESVLLNTEHESLENEFPSAINDIRNEHIIVEAIAEEEFLADNIETFEETLNESSEGENAETAHALDSEESSNECNDDECNENRDLNTDLTSHELNDDEYVDALNALNSEQTSFDSKEEDYADAIGALNTDQNSHESKEEDYADAVGALNTELTSHESTEDDYADAVNEISVESNDTYHDALDAEDIEEKNEKDSTESIEPKIKEQEQKPIIDNKVEMLEHKSNAHEARNLENLVNNDSRIESDGSDDDFHISERSPIRNALSMSASWDEVTQTQSMTENQFTGVSTTINEEEKKTDDSQSLNASLLDEKKELDEEVQAKDVSSKEWKKVEYENIESEAKISPKKSSKDAIETPKESINAPKAAINSPKAANNAPKGTIKSPKATIKSPKAANKVLKQKVVKVGSSDEGKVGDAKSRRTLRKEKKKLNAKK